MTDNRKYIALGCIFAAAVVLGIAAKGTVPPAPEASQSTAASSGGGVAAATTLVKAMMPETGTGVKLIRSDEWAEKYPNEYKTYIQNDENSEVTDYIEENPYIKTLYEGYGFAKSYGSARGHTYVFTDVTETGRPHKLANCFTCKTSDFTAAVLRDGESAYSMAFEDMEVQVTDAFGCFHCHENTPGTLYVTHPYVTNALGDDISKVDARTLSCAQCHTEYYFDPETKATTVSYQGLGKISPEDSLAYENALVDSEGNMFADWVDEDTGVRKLKVQHPEFETFLGEGSAHASFLTCADCHMEKATVEDGSTYTSHYWVSPLASESIQNNTCASCHQGGVETMVKSIQTATRDRENELGYALEQLDKDLAAAVAAGSLSDADLEAVRLASRNAQFFWDYVFVENSEGAHNSKLTNHCLDLAQQYLDEANSYLS
jgi:nitrite reductase (cytochrome c-552)